MIGSNLNYLLKNFFDELEIYDDLNRNTNHKKEIEAVILAFLDDETHEKAFKVYETFFNAYKLNMPDGGKSFIDLINMLKEYEETAGTLIDKQRDHYVHSVNVFITGLAIFGNNKNFREAFNIKIPEKEYKNAYSTKNEEFLYRWGLASLFHDVGYPIEIIHYQINRFMSIITDADGDSVKVKSKLVFSNTDEINGIADIIPKEEFSKDFIKAYGIKDEVDTRKPLDLISKKMSLTLNVPYDVTKSEVYMAKAKLDEMGYADHGLYSAIILLKWYGYLIQKYNFNSNYFFWPILDSATAIFLHNYYKNNMRKAPFNLGPLKAKDNPIAYLLIMCDELQEWNRVARGIKTKTYVLANSVNLSITDSYLGVNYITKDGKLPEEFASEKASLFQNLVDGWEIYPSGFDFDNTEVINTVEDRLPIAIHALYNEKRLKEHKEEKLQYPRYSDLPDDLKKSNERQAKGILKKLDMAGYTVDVRGKDNEVLSFSKEEIDSLARLEHQDWIDERVALGWTLGEKDVEKKKSPYLIPFDELTEEIKDYDRDTVRNIPKLLGIIGLAVYRK